MKTIILALSVFIISILWSCSDSPYGLDTMYNSPLREGNVWEYENKVEFSNFRPLTPGQTFEERVDTYTGRVESRGIHIFNNGVETYSLLSYEGIENRLRPSFSYYIKTPEALYLYGYSGGSLLAPKTNSSTKLIFHGKTFYNFQSLIDFIEQKVNHYSDSVYIENPTPKVYQYPLQVGIKWTFRDYGKPFLIEKEVIDKEVIRTPAGNFNAYVIRWYYDMDMNQIYDPDIIVTEYLHAVGLVKRVFTIKDIMITTSESPEGMGYIDLTQNIVLTSVKIN
ncbi:MAG: hypothetical protein Q8K98_05375 [Bacteroidota bacterium]|nr:hypothetical protein [Bacteroidota bacterium]